jgi:hypothetical protein
MARAHFHRQDLPLIERKRLLLQCIWQLLAFRTSSDVRSLVAIGGRADMALAAQNRRQ